MSYPLKLVADGLDAISMTAHGASQFPKLLCKGAWPQLLTFFIVKFTKSPDIRTSAYADDATLLYSYITARDGRPPVNNAPSIAMEVVMDG